MIDDIESVLIRHNLELRTNTPTDVLAKHLVECLKLFEQSLLDRSNHPFFRPGKPKGLPPHG